MAVKVIVNRHVIEANARLGRDDPPISIVRPRLPAERAHRVRLIGEPILIYDPAQKTGARVWIEAVDAEPI